MNRLRQHFDTMSEGIGRVSQVIPEMPATEARLSRLVLMVGTRLQDQLELRLKPHQLNHSEFLTLMILYSRPDGSSTPGELCELATQGATNMTRIGNALVKRGLITRGASPQDRRCVLMRITASGRRLVQKMLPPMFPSISAMFAGFSSVEKSELNRLLLLLADNLDRMSESATP